MPEITLHDGFGLNIAKIIAENNCIHNLEIGSWDGMGSTLCIIEGMKNITSKNKILHCIEINPDRCREFKKNQLICNHDVNIYLYEGSSINKESFLPKSFDEIWNSPYNHLMEGELSFPREMVRGWYEEDIKRFNNDGFLNSDRKSDHYDFVLLDGSEFTGYSEFKLLKDITKIFALDDCATAYKCSQVYYELSHDSKWELLIEDKQLRNGFAIFRKINT